MQLLVDADALLCLRQLKMIEPLAECGCTPVHMAGFALRHDLSSIQQEIEAAGERIRRVDVLVGTAAWATWKQLQQRGPDRVHKGEAEAIAWVLHQPDPGAWLFVSNDRGALRAARSHRLFATDAFGLLVAAVEWRGMDRGRTEAALAPWDDRAQFAGKPGDWHGFRETASARLRDLTTVEERFKAEQQSLRFRGP